MRRAELWWVDLGEPVGSAPGFERPAIIVSGDRFNSTTLSTVVIVPLYSNLRLAAHPGNVLVPASQSGLDRDSVANVTQLGSVDRRQLGDAIGVVPPSLMRSIDDGLRLVLSLT